MSHRRRIWSVALSELHEAARWYEQQREGLGAALLDEFEAVLDDALGRLETSVVVDHAQEGVAIRRFRLKRFDKYAIYIAVYADIPTVIAFEHSSRKPRYWRERLK